MKTSWTMAFLIGLTTLCLSAHAESKLEYENQARMMLDFAVRTNEYVRQRLQDKGLASYAQAMTETNARVAERLTPPAIYADLHPHFLLVLENTERSLAAAARGNISDYRRFQKTVAVEMKLLEALAGQAHLDLFLWER